MSEIDARSMERAGLLIFAVLLSLAGGCAPLQPVASIQFPSLSEPIRIGNAIIQLHLEGDRGQLPDQEISVWIRTAVQAITNYFGHYPVKRLDLTIHFDSGDSIHGGITYEGRTIKIAIGRATSTAAIRADWVLTHEMFHLAFPDLTEKHLWMNEGLSTYLEPIARARIGNLSVEEFWKETLEGMPEGLPETGDRGLDRTHTWGRTYWGGAFFWFSADLQIREQTRGRKSLDDAIRVILAAGGNGSVHWDIKQVIDVGDRTTGTTVLRDLYAQMGNHPDSPDLPALWKRLGVSLRGGRTVFDDAAPLAEIRKAMTARSPS
jgi:predicted metalloprotease with PDZ domain